jgi:transmembrane sensor
MDDVILRHLCGEATDGDVRALEEWRAASPENDIRFRRLQALWEGLGNLRDRQPPAARPDIDVIIGEAERRRAGPRPIRFRMPAYRSPWAGYVLAAAAMLILLFIGIRVWQVLPGRATLEVAESWTDANGVMALTLSDGTYVRTMPGTKLDFSAARGRRLVDLYGRAFFAVAPGKDPFVVWTEGGEATAVGTRFEVRTDNADTRVVVVDGEVEFLSGGERVTLRGGDVAATQPGGPLKVGSTGSVEGLWAMLDWPAPLLAFQNTPLSEVADQLEQQFAAQVRLGDASIGELRVTGSFRDSTLKEVVGAVCTVTGIACGILAPDTVILGAPPKK